MGVQKSLPAVAEPHAHTGHVTTAGRILVRAVLAVGVTVTRPALRDAVAVVALEAGGLTGVINC